MGSPCCRFSGEFYIARKTPTNEIKNRVWQNWCCQNCLNVGCLTSPYNLIIFHSLEGGINYATVRDLLMLEMSGTHIRLARLRLSHQLSDQKLIFVPSPTFHLILCGIVDSFLGYTSTPMNPAGEAWL